MKEALTLDLDVRSGVRDLVGILMQIGCILRSQKEIAHQDEERNFAIYRTTFPEGWKLQHTTAESISNLVDPSGDSRACVVLESGDFYGITAWL